MNFYSLRKQQEWFCYKNHCIPVMHSPIVSVLIMHDMLILLRWLFFKVSKVLLFCFRQDPIPHGGDREEQQCAASVSLSDLKFIKYIKPGPPPQGTFVILSSTFFFLPTSISLSHISHLICKVAQSGGEQWENSEEVPFTTMDEYTICIQIKEQKKVIVVLFVGAGFALRCTRLYMLLCWIK